MIRLRNYFFALGILLTLGALSACGGVGVSGLTVQPVVDVSETMPAAIEEAPTIETPAPAVSETAGANRASSQVVPEAQAPAGGALDAILSQQQAFIELYTRLNPSVVVIVTDGGQGSGFVFDENGHIVTNNHVVQGANQINVLFDDGAALPARLVGRDPGSDLAVLKIDSAERSLIPIPLADSDMVQVGQFVIALGSPFGLQSTMTTGIVSAIDRTFPGGASFQIPDIIQTDAAINPGNSGGPLVDVYGRVVGVNTAIESPVRGSSGIGLAVPSNIVAAIVPQLITNGVAQTPWVGISGGALTADMMADMGLEIEGGVVVATILENSPAEKAGLRAGDPATGLGGDIIVAIDGTAVYSVEDLLGFLVQKARVGQTLELTVLRDGSQIVIPLTLEARPSA